MVSSTNIAHNTRKSSVKSQIYITLGKTLCAIFKASNSITQLPIIKLDINRLISETTLTHFSVLYPIIALTHS